MKSKSPWLSFSALVAGTFVALEAAGFQSPAIPTIVKSFGIAPVLSGLILLCYYIGATTFGPVMGHFADLYGRKRMITIGLAIFAASEFLAAISTNFYFFLLCRFIQGLGSACILPAAVAFVGHLFPKEKRGFPLGVLASATYIGASIGSILGGFLVKDYGWSIIYWVSGGLALVGLVLVSLWVEETPREEKKAFDYLGTTLLFLALGSLLSVTTLGSSQGWTSPYTLSALAIGLIGVLLLWIVENRSDNPVVDLSLLKRSELSLTAFIKFFTIALQQVVTYSLVYFLVSRPGGDSSDVGFVNMFAYIASAVGGLVMGKFFADKFKTKYIIIVNFIIFGCGLILYSRMDASTPIWYAVMFVILLGLSNGSQTPALMKMALGVLPKDKLSKGSGLIVMLRDSGIPAGGATGLAVFNSINASNTQEALLNKARQAGVSDNMQTAVEQAGRSAGQVIDPGLAVHLQTLGIKFDNLLTAAKLDAIPQTMQTLAYILLGVTVILLLISFRLPDDETKDSQLVNCSNADVSV